MFISVLITACIFPLQEYSEVMLAHRDNGKYIQWNLESTAELLSHRFPDSYIFIIKPSAMNLKTFSCFSNFVESSSIGVPTHEENQGSWHHLVALLKSAVNMIQGMRNSSDLPQACESEAKSRTSHCTAAAEPNDKSENMSSGMGSRTVRSYEVGRSQTDKNDVSDISGNAATDHSGSNCNSVTDVSVAPDPEGTGPSLAMPIVIVGFSKGCVPLNQLLYDKTEAESDPDVVDLFSKVTDMFWLDGGHNGGSNTWLNDDRILEKWSKTKVVFHAHVTPYQVDDSFRRWIGTEYRRFKEKLKKRGISVLAKLHFENEERSLDNHFNVLTVF